VIGSSAHAAALDSLESPQLLSSEEARSASEGELACRKAKVSAALDDGISRIPRVLKSP